MAPAIHVGLRRTRRAKTRYVTSRSLSAFVWPWSGILLWLRMNEGEVEDGDGNQACGGCANVLDEPVQDLVPEVPTVRR